jgi:anti-anti-sigma factor
MDFEIDSTRYDGVVVVVVVGRLDEDSAPRARAQLAELFAEHPNRIIVSLEYVRLLDAAGVAVLREIGERARGEGVDVGLVTPDQTTVEVVHAAGLDPVMPRYSSVAEALLGELPVDPLGPPPPAPPAPPARPDVAVDLL